MMEGLGKYKPIHKNPRDGQEVANFISGHLGDFIKIENNSFKFAIIECPSDQDKTTMKFLNSDGEAFSKYGWVYSVPNF